MHVLKIIQYKRKTKPDRFCVRSPEYTSRTHQVPHLTMAKPRPTATAWKIISRMHCHDAQKAAEFYQAHLHFQLGDLVLGQETRMCSVFIGQKADANIYLFEKSKVDFTSSEVSIAMGRRAIDEYYEILRREGVVSIVREIGETDWGWRMFEVLDLDGNGLQFFCFLEGTNGPYEAGATDAGDE